jgi:putative nucleotidyltransferase with HDIG domain
MVFARIRSVVSYPMLAAFLYSLLTVILFVALYRNVKPETYDVELFSVADKTIRSPKTMVDREKTEEERKKAAEEVKEAYVFNEDTASNRVSLLNSIFDFVREVKMENKKEEQARLAELKNKLSENVTEDVTKSISDDVFLTLLSADDETLEKTRNAVVDSVEFVLQQRIRKEHLFDFQNQVQQAMEGYPLLPDVKRAAVEIGRYAIVPTEEYDSRLTEERKELAKKEIEPVRILQGQVIVQEGHLIDREIYRQLELLGLLNHQKSYKPVLGLLIFVMVAVFLLFYSFHKAAMPAEKKKTYLLLMAIIFAFSVLLMKIISLIGNNDSAQLSFLYPGALSSMMIAILMNERTALMVTILLAACGSIMFQNGASDTVNVEMALYLLFSGLTGSMFLSKQSRRLNILQAGVYVSIVNVFVILFIKLIGNGQYTGMEYLVFVLLAFISGIASAVLTLGLLPIFESGFGVLSTMKLIELSNPNHPLLKKILMETPGTYHHSIMVANLSEVACEAIGANGLLARVGCYYHDIGKTKRPEFFIENQMDGENPHNHLHPEESKKIIIDHVVDGAAMLRKEKLPKEIVDIAEQHHGTTLVKYFYYKAIEKKLEAAEEDYRYPGPKPQTKEIAVISIADSVEAAVRSLKRPTIEQIQFLVHNIIQDRLQDGQFNECDITLKELEIVKQTICDALNGIFHSRIEYPEMKKQTEEAT